MDGALTVEQLGKQIVVVGLGLAMLGAAVWLLGKTGFRGLPGDLRYESDGVRIYFPIVTSVVVSLVLTGLLWLWHWLRRG